MNIENGKIVKLAVVNHTSDGQIWCTYEQEGMYPDDFPDESLKKIMLGMSVAENGNVAEEYPGGLKYVPELVFRLPKDNFKGIDKLSVGMVFKTTIQSKYFSGYIKAIDDKFVTLDCNHPFVDTTEAFVGFTVVDVRAPNETEINEGFKPSFIAL